MLVPWKARSLGPTGKNITLFSGYSQKENRTTNYCLLVLKLLYEENPKLLGQVLNSLIGKEMADIVGVHFRQQMRKKGCIPDGLLVQRAFVIYIETKQFDWFYDDQLEKHLAALDDESAGAKVLIALGNFEQSSSGHFARIESICAQKYRERIYFAAVSFEDFLDALPRDEVSKNLSDTLDDFEGYLDEGGLLPRWKYRLDVVNCSGWPSEITAEHVYICPATGGSYNHARSRFFGMYKSKAVRHVALIAAVVDLIGGEAKLLWKNVEKPDADLLATAESKKQKLRPHDDSVRIFILEDLSETHFAKSTKGGMLNSKRYFDVEKLAPTSAADLAAKLQGEFWDDY